MDRLVKGILEAGGPRLIVVGGAGSLFVAPGITLRESGHLPKEWIPIVDAHIQVLRNLKQSSIDWTYFSPAGYFEPGERTGKFRLGKDDLITDAQGNSRISFADYAIALVDELENPSIAGSASPLATEHRTLQTSYSEQMKGGVDNVSRDSRGRVKS